MTSSWRDSTWSSNSASAWPAVSVLPGRSGSSGASRPAAAGVPAMASSRFRSVTATRLVLMRWTAGAAEEARKGSSPPASVNRRAGSRSARGTGLRPWHDTAVSVSLPRKILVVRTGAIGDVVNALVFASAVKAAAPDTEIGWVVHPLARPLVEGHPDVDRVHLWNKKGGIGDHLALLREIRAAGYELAVDLQRITKSALLARLSGARRVLGYDRARAKELSWLWTKERIPPGPPGAHMVEQYLEFARALGIADPPVIHRLPDDPDAAAWADGLVAELGAAPIVISLGATKPANRWPGERFGQLAEALHAAHGVPVCLVGSDADRATEKEALAALGDAANQPGVRSLVGETTLPQLAALEARARLFVGCDSGPMHLAAAQGTTVLALFGPADPNRTGPWGEAHQVLRVPPPCAPCGRRTCNQERHHCMLDLTVELVSEAVRAQLAA